MRVYQKYIFLEFEELESDILTLRICTNSKTLKVLHLKLNPDLELLDIDLEKKIK